MKLIQYSNQHTLLFISGMFAGNWIWDRCHTQINNSHQLIIEEPLCAISNNVETLTDKIGEHLITCSTPVTIVGNSLGSLVGINLARRFPNKVKQVLISGSAGFGDVNLNVRLSRDKAENIARYLMNIICHDKSRVSEVDILKTAENFSQHLRNIVGLIRASNMANGEKLLQEVACPVRAIWGEKDVITPLEHVKPILERLNIPCDVVKNCGHSPMYERPQEFAQWIDKLLNQQGSQPYTDSYRIA